ncbi:MAG: hypothetical protein KAT28_00625 [Candidatus Aenigmarchaeota archaeon]|nr:hypothetical protein [Candidatus Aenigmarchaeota archaeon]
MGHLFLDIETYSSQSNPHSSLNPYLSESKILVIAYNYYPNFKPPIKEELKSPVFLKEWKSDEKTILTEFYKFLKKIENEDNYVKIIGFNILKFDLPYLFGRMKILNIASDLELYNLLFRPFSIDLFQLSPIISDKNKKHEQLWGINHKESCKFFKLQIKEGNGLECSQFYDDKEFNKIMKYCTEEFNFEQLLDAFYLYVKDNLN